MNDRAKTNEVRNYRLSVSLQFVWNVLRSIIARMLKIIHGLQGQILIENVIMNKDKQDQRGSNAIEMEFRVYSAQFEAGNKSRL